MISCPTCGEILNQHSINNEFCEHCFADLDIDDLDEDNIIIDLDDFIEDEF